MHTIAWVLNGVGDGVHSLSLLHLYSRKIHRWTDGQTKIRMAPGMDILLPHVFLNLMPLLIANFLFLTLYSEVSNKRPGRLTGKPTNVIKLPMKLMPSYSENFCHQTTEDTYIIIKQRKIISSKSLPSLIVNYKGK